MRRQRLNEPSGTLSTMFSTNKIDVWSHGARAEAAEAAWSLKQDSRLSMLTWQITMPKLAQLAPHHVVCIHHDRCKPSVSIGPENSSGLMAGARSSLGIAQTKRVPQTLEGDEFGRCRLCYGRQSLPAFVPCAFVAGLALLTCCHSSTLETQSISRYLLTA